MTNPHRSDLYSIIRTIYRHRRFIITVTLVCIIAGIIFSFLRTKKYEAETEFFLKNPFYADRNFLYNNEARFIDYFANEDDIGRLITLSESDTVQNALIRQQQLAAAYKYNTTDPGEMMLLRKQISGQLAIIRTSNKSVLLRYTDTDPERAARVANAYVVLLEQGLRGFYNDVRLNMYQSIMSKVHEEDSAVNSLTDTLVALRKKYEVYDIVSPSRSNIISGGIRYNGKADFAEGLELVQNMESLKDQMVSNRTWHLGLASQYTTGTKLNELPLTTVVTKATEPLKASGPRKLLVAVAGALLGFFFSSLYVLATDNIKRTQITG
jgi:LPS O-antigen subunit length determinant protein (WzzB/FepE family)